MWNWFGGAAAQKRKDAPKNAILTLRQQLDMLQKRERHLESQMADQEALARKNITTNKTGMLPTTASLHSSLCGNRSHQVPLHIPPCKHD
jgi:hypothetical protein